MIILRSSSSITKLGLLFFLSFSVFILYGRSHFYRDPGSAFYDPARAYEQHYSALRLRQIEQFRDTVKLRDGGVHTPDAAQGQIPEICVAMTTVFRRDLERQYIEDAVLSMLDRITVQERASLYLSLLFTDLNATVHPSWHQPWLRAMLDNVWSYDNDTLVSAELHTWLKGITTPNIQTKATMDYTLALEKCLERTDAPYIAAFEGDILLAAGWVATTLRALKSADKLMQQRASSWWGTPKYPRDWIYVRMFNQERSTGWGSRDIGSNNELVIILVVDVVIGLAVLLLRNRNIVSSHGSDNLALAFICLLVVPVSVISFFQAGKASLLPPRPGLVVENFGCCSQALVFNRKYVPGLIKYLRELATQEADGRSGHLNYDMRTKGFAGENGLDRLSLYPMQVQHMGIKSALGTTQSEAQSVWSMAFESLKDTDVTARHDRAMDELFGVEWRATNQNL